MTIYKKIQRHIALFFMYISELPKHLRGKLYHTLKDEDVLITHPIKTDFEFNTLQDVFDIIDTFHYLGVDIPTYIFRFIKKKSNLFGPILSATPEDSFFVTTPEFRAIRLLAEYFEKHIKYSICLLEFAIKEGSLLLVKYVYEQIDLLDMHRNIYIWMRYAIKYRQYDILRFFVIKHNNGTYRHSVMFKSCIIFAENLDDKSIAEYMRSFLYT